MNNPNDLTPEGQPQCSAYDPQLGWMPAIPLPFYNQHWSWRKFRLVWVPYCIQHNREFTSDQEWQNHYVLEHIGALASPEGK